MNDFLPLAGIRVLDFTHVIAGPMATFYLHQFGAEVMKVESRSGGDVMRSPSKAQSFVALNAGKQSLRMDLRDPADLERLRTLAGEVDVLVDSLRPAVLDRCGLGADAMREAHPRLVYCTVSGFGRQGPWAKRPAYDHVIQAATGMAMMAGREGDGPIKTGFPVVDAATGILAALAIVAALRERDRTGRGRHVDVAMSAAALQLMYTMSCDALTNGNVPARIGNQGYSLSPAANMFRTQDGWIGVGANTPRQFVRLLGVLGLEAVARDPGLFEHPLDADSPPAFLRAKDPDRLHAVLAEGFAREQAAQLEARCTAANVPAARVRTLPEFAAEARANGALSTLALSDGGLRVTTPGLGFRVR